MPEYLSPGVYVEEVDAGPKPIEGVSTSTTGVVGVTERGPSGGTAPGDLTNRGKPVLVTSFAEFTSIFGGFLAEPPPNIVNHWALDPVEGGRWWLFPLSVKGFFDNGGQRLFVRRAFAAGPPGGGGGATFAATTFGQGVISEIAADATPTDTAIRLQHLLGIEDGTAITIVSGGKTLAPAAPFAVGSYNAANNSVTLNNPVGQELKAGRDFVVVGARNPLTAANSTLRFTAKSVGDWGGNLNGDHPLDGIRVRVRPMVGATLRILADPATGGNASRTAISTDAPANSAKITLDSVNGFAGTNQVSIRGHEFALVAPAANNIAAAPGGATEAGKTVTITTTAAHGLQVGDGVLVSGVAVGGYNGTWTVTVVPSPTTFEYDIPNAGLAASGGGTVAHLTVSIQPALHGAWAAATPVTRLRPANVPAPAGAGTLHVQGAGQLYQGALVELDNGANKERLTIDAIVGDSITLSGPLNRQYFEGHRLRVIEAEILTRYERDGLVQVEEDLTNVHLVDDGSVDYLVNYVNARSRLVDVETFVAGFSDSNFVDFPAPPPPAAGDPDTLWLRLDGGDDHYEQLTIDDFVGVDGGSGARTGIQALEDIEEISITAVPNIWSATVHSALITHCESLRYRFGILDSSDGLSIDGIRSVREPLDTKYAALYYPWLEVRDPSARRNVQVGPSGHMAGIYARVDVERGVHKAPANEVIEMITKISQEVTKREQDLLNPNGINALRYFPGRGNRVWGARTLSSDSSWKYINVRRLFIFVEASIDYGTQWVVFEPNDEPLWARVRQTITNFLTTVWHNGALQGAKPDEAFFVKCDHTTMTQDDIDNGRLICVIGIAPVKPAEFVIFRIQQKTMNTQGQ
jgi:phage tail sheath protein FI